MSFWFSFFKTGGVCSYMVQLLVLLAFCVSETVTTAEKDTLGSSRHAEINGLRWDSIQKYWGNWPMPLQDLYNNGKVILVSELAGVWKDKHHSHLQESKREELGNCKLVSLTLVLDDVMEQIQQKPFTNSWITRQWSGTALMNLPRANILLLNRVEKANSVNKESRCHFPWVQQGSWPHPPWCHYRQIRAVGTG